MLDTESKIINIDTVELLSKELLRNISNKNIINSSNHQSIQNELVNKYHQYVELGDFSEGVKLFSTNQITYTLESQDSEEFFFLSIEGFACKAVTNSDIFGSKTLLFNEFWLVRNFRKNTINICIRSSMNNSSHIEVGFGTDLHGSKFRFVSNFHDHHNTRIPVQKINYSKFEIIQSL